jgi:hypothetical protein
VLTYTPEQINAIRLAIAEAHATMRQQRRFEPLVFAQAFIAHGGIQIPGEPDNLGECKRLAQSVILSLEAGRPVREDANLAREIRRTQIQARWCKSAESDKVVGFRLDFDEDTLKNPNCLALLGIDHGLGTAVTRKGQILVLPPECDGYTITPVLEDEIEE